MRWSGWWWRRRPRAHLHPRPGAGGRPGAGAGARRLAWSGAGDADPFERRDPQFHERLRAGYLAIAAAEPQRCVVVDGARAPDAIAAEIWGSRRAAAAAGRALMARAPALQEDEALPEADRLEGFPHPRETRSLIGHEAAERELAQAFAGGRMHHAWLIAGPEGIGKATLAYRLARTCWHGRTSAIPRGRASRSRPRPPAARQIRALSHPGLLVLRRPYDVRSKRFAASIPVDEVRRLKSFLGLTAGEGAGAW